MGNYSSADLEGYQKHVDNLKPVSWKASTCETCEFQTNNMCRRESPQIVAVAQAGSMSLMGMAGQSYTYSSYPVVNDGDNFLPACSKYQQREGE